MTEQLETLSATVDGDGVATLTLDRPDRLNAFSVTMAGELEGWFRAAATDDEIRAVVVTGAGKAFCAGMDLSAERNVFGLDESADPTPEDMRERLTEEPFQSGVHEPDELLPAALGLARSFVRGRSPVALALAKRLLYRNAGVDRPLEAHRADSLAMWHTSVGDGKEGVAAFLEKREPRFTSRASEAPEIF